MADGISCKEEIRINPCGPDLYLYSADLPWQHPLCLYGWYLIPGLGRSGTWLRVPHPALSLYGQTLNNDGLLSVWFNDEDCQAYVRDAIFLNR